MDAITSNLTTPPSEILLKKIFLYCGIMSSLLYVAMNIFVAAQDASYSVWTQTVSELSAIGAPTRDLWVAWSFVYTFLVMAFGCGVWLIGEYRSVVRAVGGLIFIYGLLGLGWPWAPMHTRDVIASGGGTFSDTMHIVFSIVTVVLMLVSMSLGAAAFGKRFRIYTVISIAILAVFGTLTALDAPRLEANLPTPLIGIWERINIGVFLLWVVVLAIVLLQRKELTLVDPVSER